eukprot:24608_2
MASGRWEAGRSECSVGSGFVGGMELLFVAIELVGRVKEFSSGMSHQIQDLVTRSRRQLNICKSLPVRTSHKMIPRGSALLGQRKSDQTIALFRHVPQLTQQMRALADVCANRLLIRPLVQSPTVRQTTETTL